MTKKNNGVSIPTKNVQISVIIPTYNEEENLSACLLALKSSDFSDYEILIVDGNSKDRTIEIAKKHGCRVYKRKRSGIGDARNFGAMKSSGEILAFLDADSIPCPGWLTKLSTSFNGGALAVGGPTHYGNLLSDLLSSSIFYSNLITKHLGFWYFSGNNIAIKRQFFFNTGMYRSILCEDIEYSKRLAPYYHRLNFNWGMRVKLSNRRFEKLGYFNTLKFWLLTDLMIFLGKYPEPGDYSDIIR